MEGLDDRNVRNLDITIDFKISVKEGESVREALKTINNITRLIGETMTEENRLRDNHIELKIKCRS